MKQIASPGSMHKTGCSGLVHWDDPEGLLEHGDILFAPPVMASFVCLLLFVCLFLVILSF